MKEFWSMVQLVFTGIGGWLGYFLGGCDGLILALLLFVVADYITGIMCAIADKKLSSEVGFKGICRKVLIFTGRNCKCVGCAGHRKWFHFENGGDLFLSQQ